MFPSSLVVFYIISLSLLLSSLRRNSLGGYPGRCGCTGAISALTTANRSEAVIDKSVIVPGLNEVYCILTYCAFWYTNDKDKAWWWISCLRASRSSSIKLLQLREISSFMHFTYVVKLVREEVHDCMSLSAFPIAGACSGGMQCACLWAYFPVDSLAGV